MGSNLSLRSALNQPTTSSYEFERLPHTQLIDLLEDGTFSEMAAFINDTVSSLYYHGLEVLSYGLQILD